MGSIAAVMSSGPQPHLRRVEDMLRAAPHRGTRIRSVQHRQCALGAAAADDRDDASLEIRDGLAAAVTGTIDNLETLGRELGLGNGGALTPAAVLLSAFRASGADTPNRLRGIFSAVITDGRQLWAFRDHVGFSTLFHGEEAGSVRVANEAKQVAATSRHTPEPDLDALEAIFWGRYDDATPSALQGVQRLPKATLLHTDGKEVRRRRYWHPEELLETARYSPDEVRERFDALMGRATERALTGRDGVSLSGGIDAPVVAAFANGPHLARSGRPLTAITRIYPGLPCDELPYVEAIVAQLGLHLVTYQPKTAVTSRLDEWVRLFDGPAPFWSPNEGFEHYCFARQHGYRNLLSGEVAEFVMAMSGNVVTHLLHHGRLRPLWRYLRAERAQGYTRRAIRRQLATAIAPPSVLRTYFRHRRRPRRDLWRVSWLDVPTARDVPHPLGLPVRQRWREDQLAAFIGPGLAAEAESICQQLAGVTVRRPWADVDLWEFFLSLPAEVKYPNPWTKSLVRSLARGRLPDLVLDRRDKTYFDAYVMGSIDYPSLRRWLIKPDHRLPGVRYNELADVLDREALRLGDYIWARDLAAVHAFLSLW